jgi:hypothetical protein
MRTQMQTQKELFDGFVRLRQCRCCRRQLHPDPENHYRTREAGLCYRCLALFVRSDFYVVENFIEAQKREDR